MMRRFLACLTLVVMVIAVTCGFTFASDMKSGQLVYDEGDFLTAAEESELQAAAATASKKVKADVLVVFTDDPYSNDARTSAEEICRTWRNGGNANYKNNATILVYVDMANRVVFINEYNEGKNKLKDSAIDTIKNSAAAAMAGGYAEGAMAAVTGIQKKAGGFNAIWSVIAGAIGGGLATLIGVGKHSGVARVARRYYLKDGQVTVVAKRDLLVNTTTKVIERSAPEKASGDEPSQAGSAGNHGGGASF